MKKILIIFMSAIMCLSLSGCSGSGSKEEIKELNSIGRWGNLILNISYKIPAPLQGSMARGANSFTYLNGHNFSYASNWKIYVETLLEGTADLEKLPVQISEEKRSANNKPIYDEITSRYIENIAKTEKKKVTELDTIYFESEPTSVESMNGGSMQMKAIGYSFMFENKPVCIYGEVEVDSKGITEADLNDYLKYVISTIEPYNGESFVELDQDAVWNESDYLNGNSFPLNDTLGSMEYDFTLYHPDDHATNGIFGINDPLKQYWNQVDDRYGLGKEGLKLEDIFTTVCAADKYDIIPSSGNTKKYELFSEPQSITINGISMLRYNGATMNTLPGSSSDSTVYPYSRYFVVYTFQYEGKSYFFQYELGLRMYEVKAEAAWKQLQKFTDLNADTVIRTIMTKTQVASAETNFESKTTEEKK